MATYKNYDELCRETKQMPPDTDLLAFTNLYKRFGIECKIEDVSKDGKVTGYAIILSVNEDRWHDRDTIVTTNEKITGYNGFYTSISFDENGQFKGQEIIE